MSELVTWTSSNTAVATIDAGGLVTALSAGQTTITARSQSTPLVAASIGITVVAPTPTFTGTLYISVPRSQFPGGPSSLDIVAVNPASGAETDLTKASTLSERLPFVSPDGKYLFYFQGDLGALPAFLMKVDGSQTQSINGLPVGWFTDGRLFIYANSAYSTLNVTTGLAQPFILPASLPAPASLSPAGDKVAYEIGTALYVTTLATGAAVQVMPACAFATSCGAYAWSSDGSFVVAARDGALVKAGADGLSRATVYNASLGLLGALAISPDGRYLAFADGDVLKLLRLDGTSALSTLSDAADYIDAPTWSPDSQSLAFGAPDFLGPADFGTHVVVMSVTGANRHNVASIAGSGSISGIAWGR